MSKPSEGLSGGRFWAENQDQELTVTIPRRVMLLAIGALINRDALDLAPMLLGPANGPRQ